MGAGGGGGHFIASSVGQTAAAMVGCGMEVGFVFDVGGVYVLGCECWRKFQELEYVSARSQAWLHSAE